MTAPSIESFLGADLESTPETPRDHEVAPAVREYLAAARAHLKEMHEAGAAGSRVNETHSDLIDRLIRRLFELSEESYFVEGGEGPSELCVVAVGGYARREMSLHSDVDILFLHGDRINPYVASVAERVQYWLWDAQVTVGGATRTIKETIDLAPRCWPRASSWAAGCSSIASGRRFTRAC